MHAPALCRLLICAICLVRVEQFTCRVFCMFLLHVLLLQVLYFKCGCAARMVIIEQWFSNFLHQVPLQKIFGFPSTTIMTNIKMQYKWLPTAPGVCSRCVCVCVFTAVCVCVCVCVRALWMG